MSFDRIFDLTAGVYFHFFIIYWGSMRILVIQKELGKKRGYLYPSTRPDFDIRASIYDIENGERPLTAPFVETNVTVGLHLEFSEDPFSH